MALRKSRVHTVYLPRPAAVRDLQIETGLLQIILVLVHVQREVVRVVRVHIHYAHTTCISCKAVVAGHGAPPVRWRALETRAQTQLPKPRLMPRSDVALRQANSRRDGVQSLDSDYSSRMSNVES